MIWSCQTGNKKAWDFSWCAVRKLHWKPTWKLELVAGLKHCKTIAKSQNCWDSMFDYWRESHFYGLSISIISHLQTNGQRIYVYIYIYIQWYVHCLITHNYKCIQYIRYISHSPLKLGLPLIHPMVYHHFAYETGQGWGYPPFSHTFLDEQLEIRVIFIPSARPSLWLSLLPPVSLPFPTCPVALRLHLKF